MASKETENGSEYNFKLYNKLIMFPSNTGHNSLSTKLLAPWIYSSRLTKL